MGQRSIISKHEKIFDFLLKLHEKDNNFFFVPRKINNQNRLGEGYWFIGNDRYLQVSFWNGTDWKEKIHNIAFVVLDDGNSYLEFSAQDSMEKADFLRMLINKLGGFKRVGKKNKWQREYTGTNYISNLKEFLKHEKPIIDEMLRKHLPKDIYFLDEAFHRKYVDNVVSLRSRQKKFGATHKIARICWNTEKWKFPSGYKGKSTDQNSHEAKYGYGHEEWLFDKSRIIEGYHYAFLEPLRVESGKHFGKIYNISLFTINGEKRKFYIGDIKNVVCITKEEAEKAYSIYERNNWIKEMTEDIKRVGADHSVFSKSLPNLIFNVKFRFEDVKILDELEEISNEDVNITTSRFKLLPKKTDFVIKEVLDDETVGNYRSEAKRKVVFKQEVEYDPYHSIMQNAITRLLREEYQGEYAIVCVEKGRVDIKAKTHAGNWHYFEIKTDTPKLCIRTALGQIMEYAYWVNCKRAEKLIVVGSTEPDKNSKKYLEYIRDEFAIPVYYRWFNLEENALSEDY